MILVRPCGHDSKHRIYTGSECGPCNQQLVSPGHAQEVLAGRQAPGMRWACWLGHAECLWRGRRVLGLLHGWQFDYDGHLRARQMSRDYLRT